MSTRKITVLAGIAAGQWGMITTAQAVAADVSAQAVARLANDGQLERLAHGIYRLAGTPPHPHDEIRALWLGIDPRRVASDRIADVEVAVVSHRSAAVLLELGDIAADVVEFTVATRHQTRRRDVRIHHGTVGASERTLVDGLPVTTPLRTISDLASSRLDRGHLGGVVRDAVIEHHLPVAKAAAILSQHAREYGAAAGNGMALVELMLDEAGLPQATLDAVAHLSGVTQVVDLDSSRAVQDALRGSVSLVSTRQSPPGG
jgi:Transcriptional regulator, AbiEi antitoxin